MENKSLTPISDAAEKQLELRKQFISDYSNQQTIVLTEKIKSAFDVSIYGIEMKQKELMHQSQEMLQIQNPILINTEESTDKQTDI